MSQGFFGFNTALPQDHDRLALGEGEDLAVYTFGEEGYDDLAKDFNEELDELNDETFGESDTVGAWYFHSANFVQM
jgi:DNA topoisomerase 2-associated protein PAT1